MLKYTLKRIVLIFFTMFIILTLAYILIQLTTSFEERVKFYQMSDPKISYEEAVIYGKKAGWDDPILIKYFNWIKGVFTGNWGVSVVYEVGQNPWTILTRFIPFTISINIWPLLIATPLGFLFGIIAALRKNKPTDYIISLLVMICISVPSFVFVTLLMINASNMGLPIQFRAADQANWKDYIIPVIALSVGPIASLTRITRAELTEVLTSEYLLLARTKGLNRFQATIRHALRNSLLPLVPSIIGSFVGIMFGSLVIEQIYGIKGVGGILLTAISETQPDHDLAMAALSFYTIIDLVTILIVDLAYGIVDPRIRMGAR
ncbi:aBC-type dipeptide/oligopeptide/nickel transport systems permease components [Staphylococcus sp. CAG:324]|nr:ABC transporter permease [Staphylococcus sp.]CDC69098.1 aBC-type dipeptide/oligopeptide/nickel transport systems permease components [Staphylococcus sp. CAG:324]